jgi:uncharacterized membrane protein YdjX (TVP38/TMEM64 family)
MGPAGLVLMSRGRAGGVPRSQVTKRKDDLLNYVIFLRVTPLLPNTFINVASPVVGVPLLPFMLGECTGV